jgi:hypothetical protein
VVKYNRIPQNRGFKNMRTNAILITILAAWAVVFTQPSADAASCCGKRRMMSEYLRDSQYNQSTQYGHKKLSFTVNDHKGFIVLPDPSMDEKPLRWIWYAPTFDGVLPNDRQTWIFSRLLAKGFAVCGIDIGESFGSIEGRDISTAFYKFVTSKFNLSPKACLWVQSRGGLMHFNWAADHPELISCIGATYPICMLGTYSGYKIPAEAYGITEEDLMKRLPDFNPIDRLAPLAKHKIPIFSIHGDVDTVVPLESNSLELSKRYKELGGQIELITIKGKGHEEVNEFFESQPMLDFFIKNAK